MTHSGLKPFVGFGQCFEEGLVDELPLLLLRHIGWPSGSARQLALAGASMAYSLEAIVILLPDDTEERGVLVADRCGVR